jgi:glycosyltransferase involved in cell wall biosynthesis
VVLTETYPWSDAGEATFLDPELPRLADRFEVVVVPTAGRGARGTVDPRVTVRAPATAVPGWRRALAAVVPLTWPVVRGELRRGDLPRRVRPLLRLLRHGQRAELVRRAVEQVLGDRDVPALVYSYWFGPAATAAVRVRDAHRDRVRAVLTRAHGYDLFHEVNEDSYIPLRRATIDALDAVLSVSRAGESYLRARYPSAAGRIGHAPLGTEDPGFVVVPTDGGHRHVVSCATCVPVKRIPLVVDVVARAAADLEGAASLRWTHLGGGPELAAVAERAEQVLGGRVDYRLAGAVPGEAVLRTYRDEGADALVSVSRSEGRPVSMMEAQSVGVPIVATDVGGVGELVDAEVGALVDADADADEIGTALARLLAAPRGERGRRHAAARARWESTSDAGVVHRQFADRLAALAGAR